MVVFVMSYTFSDFLTFWTKLVFEFVSKLWYKYICLFITMGLKFGNLSHCTLSRFLILNFVIFKNVNDIDTVNHLYLAGIFILALMAVN